MSLELSSDVTAAQLPIYCPVSSHGGVDVRREEVGAHGVVSDDPVLWVRCSKAALFVSL